VPIYEYVCRACGEQFEKIVTASTQPACPKCQATELEQQFSVFAVGGKNAMAAASNRAPGPCTSCGDPRGPGSCSLH
jgi:putative FmdB family regulatory protein